MVVVMVVVAAEAVGDGNTDCDYDDNDNNNNDDDDDDDGCDEDDAQRQSHTFEIEFKESFGVGPHGQALQQGLHSRSIWRSCLSISFTNQRGKVCRSISHAIGQDATRATQHHKPHQTVSIVQSTIAATRPKRTIKFS